MQKQILQHSLKTLSWLGGDIVDWSRTGTLYSLNGQSKQINFYHFAFPFDSSINTLDGKYVFLFQKRGTKGLLLKDGEILREINRSYYQAHVYEYPTLFLTYNSTTYLVHCPVSYNRIDFEEVETGKIITNHPDRNPSDIFHSRLELSLNNRYLMSKGWVWHPLSVVQVYDIENCFHNPTELDKEPFDNVFVGTEISTASFIDDSRILIGSSEDVIDSEISQFLPPRSIAIWDIGSKTISTPIKIRNEFGNLFAIDDDYARDIYKYPKIINIKTGIVEDKEEEIFSGEQTSSVILTETPPKIAFNTQKTKLAVAIPNATAILTIEVEENK